MIHVILKCPLNLAAAVILVIMALNSPVESKTISPSFESESFFFGCFICLSPPPILSIIRSVCLSFRLSSVCLLFLQLSLCRCGAASVPLRGHILCRGDKRQADGGWHASKDEISCLTPESFWLNHVTGASWTTPLRWTYMNAKVAVVGFTTRPIRCVWIRGRNIESRSPDEDTMAWESFFVCFFIS